jgi:hypothetical protein
LTKNRLTNPSEILTLDFKGEFRRFEICSVSATTGSDRPIFDLRGDEAGIRSAKENTVGSSLSSVAQAKR